MRLAALLLLLAAPAAAQPHLAPADSVRVEQILDAMQLERQIATSLSRIAANPLTADAVDRVTPSTVRAAVRARLVDGYTPARGDTLRVGLADGRYALFLDRLFTLQDSTYQDEMLDAMLAPPKKGVLGDSVAAARFVRASGLADYTRATLHDLFAGLSERVPAARAEFERTGMTPERVAEEQVAELVPLFVLSFRVAARHAPPAETATVLAFAESDAGRYASMAVFDGLRDVFVPVLVDALAGAVEAGQFGTPPPPALDE